jgi:hypothetical protein
MTIRQQHDNYVAEGLTKATGAGQVLPPKPRWMPGSLAQWIGENLIGYLRPTLIDSRSTGEPVYCFGAQVAPADVVEELTKSARLAERVMAQWEELSETQRMVAVVSLRAALEQAEKWGKP